MGIPVLRVFDHKSPEWPENERRYLDGYLRQQSIMHGVVYGAALVMIIVFAIAAALR